MLPAPGVTLFFLRFTTVAWSSGWTVLLGYFVSIFLCLFFPPSSIGFGVTMFTKLLIVPHSVVPGCVGCLGALASGRALRIGAAESNNLVTTGSFRR